ncbi:unnamed protein product [Hymenolepis diminuta]|uniref:peptidyl-tRNA hydrolase n=1 Tax=Hymenolepis diminuta TaxID=6216 RepID=A0A564YWF8_HYMDI|nr:unnamed protein product [Hymenolepis diminuta]
MDYFSPFVQSLVAAGVGFIAGWYLRKGCPSKCAVMKMKSFVDSDLKLVLVVRNDLGMTKGKVAAQCSHATLGCYQMAMEKCPDVVKVWESLGQMKIVLRAPDYNTLEDLRKKAYKAGLPHCLVHDAGHTQVAPGSATVLGIGPAESTTIDEITGHLKLY